MVGAGEAMKATVILPTYNRAESLDRCLSALTRQSLKAGEFEVIVVVNGSTDQTLHVVKRYATALNLSVASLPEPGLHAARHEGMRRAAADVLLFADDDTEAGTGWVDSVVRTFEDPRVLIVGGNNYPAFQEPPPRWLTQLWETPVYKGRALPQSEYSRFWRRRLRSRSRVRMGLQFFDTQERADRRRRVPPGRLSRKPLAVFGGMEKPMSPGRSAARAV